MVLFFFSLVESFMTKLLKFNKKKKNTVLVKINSISTISSIVVNWDSEKN